MITGIVVVLAIAAAVVVGFCLGVVAIVLGGFEALKNIDGPPKTSMWQDYKNRRAYKKEQKP